MTPSARPRDLVAFVGGRTVAYLLLSVVAGFALFCVEVGFTYALQSFLLLVGIATRTTLQPPGWLPHSHAAAIISAVFVLSVLRGALLWAQTYMRSAAGERFSTLQRSRILRWAFYSQGAASSHITSLFGERATQAGDWVRQAVTGLNLSTLSVFLLVALFYVQPYLTLAVVGVMLVLMTPVRFMNRRIRLSGKGVVAEWEATYRRLVLGIKNLLLLRIYGLEEAEERQASASLRSYLRHYLAFHTSAALFTTIPQTLGVTLSCVLLWLTRSHLQLTAGLLLAYFYLLLRLLQNSAPLGQAFANAAFQWPQFSDMYRWWRAEYLPSSAGTVPPALSREPEPPSAAAVGWRCREIGFTYPGAAQPVLSGLSFDIVPGSAVVITGPSGSGKSTLLNVLLGELAPRDGRVDLIVDGRVAPLADCKPRLLPMVGYVGAESFLIDGTIRENLLYGVHHRPSEGELVDALRTAECAFIDDLPRGLDHRLTEQGAGLSSGQKQRLSLARALLRRPSVLVLDEATANLDVGTEDKLVDTLAQLKGGMTIVAVTHRQPLLRLADQVLALGPTT